jgi:hypothetical protein
MENLKQFAIELPNHHRDNATALLNKMAHVHVIEGLGDDPEKAEWQPRNLKLVQALSDRSKFQKGTPNGALVLGGAVQEQPMRVIPLLVWNTRYMQFTDQNETNFICASPDGKASYSGVVCNTCPHYKCNENSKKSVCSASYEFLVIKSNLTDIFKIIFTKSSYRIGRSWKDNIKKDGRQMFDRQYSLRTETNAKSNHAISFRYYCEVPEEIKKFVQAVSNHYIHDRMVKMHLLRSKTIVERKSPGEAMNDLVSKVSSVFTERPINSRFQRLLWWLSKRMPHMASNTQ